MKDRKRTYDKRNITKLEEETIQFFKLNTERFSIESDLNKKSKKSKVRNPEEARLSVRVEEDPVKT